MVTAPFRYRRILLPMLVGLAFIAAGCSAASGSSVPAPSIPVGAGQASSGPVPGGTDGGTIGAIDPCQKLTKADVQPFFSVPVVTELPGPKEVGDTCEFQANDAPGGVSTALDINVRTGQDATEWWSTAGGATSGATMFSGVGDQAEHFPGSTDFVSISGQVACGLTTTGYEHLAGKASYQPGSMPNDAATQIAQAYGTLCNKIYGRGSTTPTITASPAVDLSSASATPGPSIVTVAQGGTLGQGFPLPVGLDCSGVTATDSEGTITCSATNVADPKSIYPFYLSSLPATGYTINHESEGTGQDGSEIASIIFEGPGAGAFSTISVLGGRVTVTLEAP
jgi:hypothetical protein